MNFLLKIWQENELLVVNFTVLVSKNEKKSYPRSLKMNSECYQTLPYVS